MNEEPIYDKLLAIGNRHLKNYAKGDMSTPRVIKEIASQIGPLAARKEREYGDRKFGMSKDERMLLANELYVPVREHMDYRLKEEFGFDPKSATPSERDFVYDELLRAERGRREARARERLRSHYLTNLRAPLNPEDYSAIKNATHYDSELRKKLR